MPRSHRLLLLLFISAKSVLAQLDMSSPATQDKCAQAFKGRLPAEAVSISPPQAWPVCNSYKLYAGIGVAVDFTTARHCAWTERSASLAGLEPRYSNASVFGGSAMLTVLYTNGEGVARNLPLAIRFACEAGGAPAEIGIRLKDLENRINFPNAKHPKFTFCDATTSGFMMGFCSALDEEEHSFDRKAKLARLSQSWPENHKKAFAHVVSLQEMYAEAHARGEIDLSGTARAMFEIDAESSLKDDFLEAMIAFEAGKLPHATDANATKADEALNDAYRQYLQAANEHKSEYGAIQPEGIRQTERAWLQYRDTWLDFAALHYPGVPHESWLQLLTIDRTLILSGKSCGALEDCGGEEQWSPRPLP